MIQFTVEGNPLPKQSYRARSGGGGYTAPRIKAWQTRVAIYATLEMGGRDPMEGNMVIELRFFRGDKRRVDVDNLTKPVKDACNQIVFLDDSQVKEAHLYLDYDKKNPRVEVKVWEREE